MNNNKIIICKCSDNFLLQYEDEVIKTNNTNAVWNLNGVLVYATIKIITNFSVYAYNKTLPILIFNEGCPIKPVEFKECEDIYNKVKDKYYFTYNSYGILLNILQLVLVNWDG